MCDFGFRSIHLGEGFAKKTRNRAHDWISTGLIEPCVQRPLIVKVAAVALVALTIVVLIQCKLALPLLIFAWKAVVMMGNTCIAVAPHVVSTAAAVAASAGVVGASCVGVAAGLSLALKRALAQEIDYACRKDQAQEVRAADNDEELESAFRAAETPAPSHLDEIEEDSHDVELESAFRAEENPAPSHPDEIEEDSHDVELESAFRAEENPDRALDRQDGSLESSKEPSVRIDNVELLRTVIAQAHSQASEYNMRATGICFMKTQQGLEMSFAVKTKQGEPLLFEYPSLPLQQRVKLLSYLQKMGSWDVGAKELSSGDVFTLRLPPGRVSRL